MKKGQAAMEWLFAIGAVFLIFLLLLGFSFDKRVEVIKTERFTNLRDECLKVSELIMSNFIGGNGTQIQSQLFYNVSIDPDNGLIIVGDKDIVTCTVPINQITEVILEEGLIILENRGDFINLVNG